MTQGLLLIAGGALTVASLGGSTLLAGAVGTAELVDGGASVGALGAGGYGMIDQGINGGGNIDVDALRTQMLLGGGLGALGGAATAYANRTPTATTVATTGQEHHVISRRIAAALDDHSALAGQYTPRDPRLVTQALDDQAHRGYQTWHRELDAEVVDWLARNPNAGPFSSNRSLARDMHSPIW